MGHGMIVATPPSAHSPGAGSADYPLGYNPAFDGLRAVAVLAVILLHFHVPGFSGGAIGVDVFFVLSGYLITSLLLRGIARGQPLGVFYWQRFLRLAPPLVLLCAALLGIAPLFGASSQAMADSLASLLYVSNWTSAFHAEGVPMFLGNTWSLAIEEQFYLLWPILLLGMLRIGGGRFPLAASLTLLVVSLLWQRWQIAGGGDYERIYFGFDTRCSGLLIGCSVALSKDHLARVHRCVRLAGLIGAAFFLAIVATSAWSPSVSFGVSLAAGMVIADLATSAHGPIQFVLSRRAPVAIGRISYALYLWHYPIMLMLSRHFAWRSNPRVARHLPLAALRDSILFHHRTAGAAPEERASPTFDSARRPIGSAGFLHRNVRCHRHLLVGRHHQPDKSAAGRNRWLRTTEYSPRRDLQFAARRQLGDVDHHVKIGSAHRTDQGRFGRA